MASRRVSAELVAAVDVEHVLDVLANDGVGDRLAGW
jgi:hypothetical protein